MNKEFIKLAAIIIFGLLAPYLFPTKIVFFTFLCIFILFAQTWDIQGGQTGYNSFGNIVFFGIGMYLTASTQIGIAFDISEWTKPGGTENYIHTNSQYFTGLILGLIVAGIIPPIIAFIIGSSVFRLRDQYFAICTLGMGVAAGQIVGGINFLGGTSGIMMPIWPKDVGSIEANKFFFYYTSFALMVACMLLLKWLYSTKFLLAINAVRDDEDKAVAMGINTTAYKTIGWMISAFFLGIAGGIVGNVIGFIDPTDTAFAGQTFGVFMILMAILGGKGSFWGPILGATIFHFFKEFFWTYFLGWQYVALGLLIVLIIVFSPEGIMGWFKEKYPKLFGVYVEKKEN